MKVVIVIVNALMLVVKETASFAPLYHNRNAADPSKIQYQANGVLPAPSSWKARVKTRSRQRIWLSLPSSPTKNDEQSFVEQKHQIAKETLIKLLKRQEKEVQETKELIKSLDDLPTTKDDTNSTQVLSSSITASLLSGFHYGFVSRSEGCRFEDIDDFDDQIFENYGPPANIFSLGTQQFMRNLNAMMGEYTDAGDVQLTRKQKSVRQKLKQLTLNSTAIWERERSRGPLVAPLLIKVPYLVLCYLLDVVFEGRYVPSRFFLLETVARMPYFSYISMLHLYETLGFWRRSKDVKRVHFAEEWNEFHHLLIMESLGGDQTWWVRFMSQHSAIVYFVVLTILFTISPSLSYKFSELLETHAVDTYGQFLDENEELLKELPPSLAAVEYYTIGVSDPMFGEYQTSAVAAGTDIRKSGTSMKNLYDVFDAIRCDECDHVGTMKACLDPKVSVLSPSLESRFLIGLALSTTVGNLLLTDDIVDVSPLLVESSLADSLPVAESISKDLLDQLVIYLKDVELIDADLDVVIPFFDGFTLEAIGQAFVSLIKAAGLL